MAAGIPARLSVRSGRRPLGVLVLFVMGRGGALEKCSMGSGLGAARPEEINMVHVFWRKRRGCDCSLLSVRVGEALRLEPTASACGAFWSCASGASGSGQCGLVGYSNREPTFVRHCQPQLQQVRTNRR